MPSPMGAEAELNRLCREITFIGCHASTCRTIGHSVGIEPTLSSGSASVAHFFGNAAAPPCNVFVMMYPLNYNGSCHVPYPPVVCLPSSAIISARGPEAERLSG